MTITVTDIDQGPFTATGLAQTVAYTFMTLTDEEISVFYDAGTGRVEVDASDYVVTRNRNVDGSAKEGGSVALEVGSAPAGSSIYLRAAPRDYRDLVWSDTGSRLKNLNEEQDRQVLRALVIKDKLDRNVEGMAEAGAAAGATSGATAGAAAGTTAGDAAGTAAANAVVGLKADKRATDPKSAPFNASGDGVTLDQSAFNAATTAAETSGAMVVPTGVYLLYDTLRMTDAAVTFSGFGESNSVLKWDAAGGIDVTNTVTNQREVVFEGVRLETSVANAGTAISITQPDMVTPPAGRTARLSNVFIGQEFGSPGYWNVGVDLTECREFIGDGLTLAGLGAVGIGLRINSSDFSTNYLIDKSWFFSWDTGIEFNEAVTGTDGPEGLHVQQCIFISCNTGIHWNCPDKPETLLMVEGSHFDCFDAGIDAEGCLQGLVVGCHLQQQFDSTGTTFGARFSESSEIIVSSNVFHKPGATGDWRPVRLVDTQHAVVIGNTFEGYVEGVELDPDSSNIKILANDWHDRAAPPVAINGATNVNVQSFEGRTAMPSAGYWTRGEFVYNVEPVITNGMVLTGWRRLTTGNDHAAGTDWAGEYAPVDGVLRASIAWDPISTPAGGQNYVDVTVAGAAAGDFAQASSTDSLSELTLSASVTATNTVRVYLQNLTGGAVDLGSITVRVKVTK